VSGSGISWAMCKSAPHYRRITTPASHHSVFVQVGCPSCRPNNSVKALKAHSLTLETKSTSEKWIKNKERKTNNYNDNNNYDMEHIYITNKTRMRAIAASQFAFSALTLLVGRQEEHPVCEN